MKQFIYKNALQIAVAWTCVIFALCCMPGQYIPRANWLELLSFDKFVHASIFFVLVCLWLVYLATKQSIKLKSICLIVALCILYGGLLEVMQATVFSQRSADWFDFIANSFGCLMGYFYFNKKLRGS